MIDCPITEWLAPKTRRFEGLKMDVFDDCLALLTDNQLKFLEKLERNCKHEEVCFEDCNDFDQAVFGIQLK